MISIQQYYKSIFKYSQIQNTGELRCSGTNVLLISDFSSSTRGERQFLQVFRIILCKQHPNARHISWSNLNFSTPWSDPNFSTSLSDHNFSTTWSDPNFSTSLSDHNFSTPWSDPNFSTTWSDPNFSTPWSDPNFSTSLSDLNFSTTWSDPNFSTPWSELNCCDFFKIFQILSPSFLGLTSSTLQPHFLSGVYYDSHHCHILCARA